MLIILIIIFSVLAVALISEDIRTWWIPAMMAAVLGTFVITKFDVSHDCKKMGMFMAGGEVYVCKPNSEKVK